MSHINIEIKAKSTNQDFVRDILKERHAEFKGVDHQIDTYFKVSKGRLKLRQGNIENTLIHYQREDKAGPKQSDVSLFKATDNQDELKKILTDALGILAIVDKKREIYFIDNVKFHVDTVKDLGTFVEIEAIDDTGKIAKEQLLKQCQLYLKLFKIKEQDLIIVSYSDLIIGMGI